MRKLFVVICVTFSGMAFAQADSRSTNGPHSVSVLASFPRGGFSLGGVYEYMMQDSLGVEGHFRFFAKEDDISKRSDGIVIVGAGVGHHFYKKTWDLAFTPSVNVINIDAATAGADDTTAIGPGLSVSMLAQLTPNVGLGFDWGNYWVWFDDDYAGKRVDDLAIKARFSF